MKIFDVIIWKDKADDIIGEDLEIFVDFLANFYKKKTTIYSYSMRELREALVSWTKYENLKRNGQLDAMTTGNETETADAVSIVQDDSQFVFQDHEGLDMEKHNLRQRGMDLIKLKMETYSEKIQDIFDTHVERPESDSEGEDFPILKAAFVVRISRLSRVLNDLGAFVGLAFNTFNSFLSNMHDTRKSEKGVIEDMQHFMWLKDHKEKIEQERGKPT